MSKNKKIAASIFITAFAFGLNITGISPVLGELNERYHEYGTSTVQLLQTISYLLLIVGSFLVGWLTTKTSKKKIIMAGLFIIGVCGVIPFFTESFAALLLLRLLIGFGFGIVGPMNTAVITDFFSPKDRPPYMGLHVVGMGVGTMAGNLLGGMLAGIEYRFFYLVYTIAFLGALGVKVFLIETPPVRTRKSSEMKLNRMVFAVSFASFIHTLLINVYSTNIGIYILNNITKNPSITGVVTAVNAAAALLVGVFFAQISGILKKYTMAFSIFAAAAGYGGILLIPGIAGVYLGSIFCGVSLSCFMAYGSYLISISVEQEAVAKASGMFAIIGGIGGLIAPIVLGKAAEFILGANSAVNQFMIALVGMAVFGSVVLLVSVSRKERRKIV